MTATQGDVSQIGLDSDALNGDGEYFPIASVNRRAGFGEEYGFLIGLAVTVFDDADAFWPNEDAAEMAVGVFDKNRSDDDAVKFDPSLDDSVLEGGRPGDERGELVWRVLDALQRAVG